MSQYVVGWLVGWLVGWPVLHVQFSCLNITYHSHNLNYTLNEEPSTQVLSWKRGSRDLTFVGPSFVEINLLVSCLEPNALKFHYFVQKDRVH
jgi:hypothetical protein